MSRLRTNFLTGLTTALIMLAGFGSIGLRPSTMTSPMGKINFLLGREGEVMIHHSHVGAWVPAKLRMNILRGDRIKTAAESRCELKLNDGSIIRIGEKSFFDFAESNLTKSTRQVNASLTQGRIWANVTKWTIQRDQFEIKSPTAVCAIRGTIYRMETDSTTRVAVYDGQVDIGPTPDLQQQLQQQQRPTGAPVQIPGPTQVPGPYQVTLEQWIRLVEGYQIEIRGNGRYATSKIDSTAESQVDWIQWNKERDRLLQ
ncbi:MAG: FecR family protein [candidate division KSB1 bacterium]|nr:FecR family protein [candidate division KSB1 bacterium]MDZ7300542.1 FecR family protein [candidate division KSB1 bacterium]MDZ7309681.1 FecR family protein [candidate division KSB1 bacterium]